MPRKAKVGNHVWVLCYDQNGPLCNEICVTQLPFRTWNAAYRALQVWMDDRPFGRRSYSSVTIVKYAIMLVDEHGNIIGMKPVED